MTVRRPLPPSGPMSFGGSGMPPRGPGLAPVTSDQIRDFVVGQGWATPEAGVTNPDATLAWARREGVGAQQLDAAGGFAPGTANSYATRNGGPSLGYDSRLGPPQFRPPPQFARVQRPPMGGTPPASGPSFISGPQGSSGGLSGAPSLQPSPSLQNALYGRRMNPSVGPAGMNNLSPRRRFL